MRRVLSTSLGLALVALCACGGGFHRVPTGLVSLTGRWLLTPESAGVAGDAVHLTVTQTGTTVGALATCMSSWPAGVGSWDGTTFLLTFDFGGGSVVALAGGAVGDGLSGTFASPEGPGTFTLDRTDIALACEHACDAIVVAPFVDTDFTELGKIEEISLFRSSAGHDYSDDCEDCRSMKHYFAPYAVHRVNGDVAVRSPVAGQITSVTAESHGASGPTTNKQVRIRSSLRPDVQFILFHIDLAAGVEAGDLVAAGDLMGTARLEYPDLGETAHDFDVAVRVHTLYGDRYVSWFDVVTDALFSTYMARGATARSDFVISKAARDADPLGCTGETFTSTGSLPAWFPLGP